MSLLLLIRRLAVFVLAGALPCAAVGYSLGRVRGLLIAGSGICPLLSSLPHFVRKRRFSKPIGSAPKRPRVSAARLIVYVVCSEVREPRDVQLQRSGATGLGGPKPGKSWLDPFERGSARCSDRRRTCVRCFARVRAPAAGTGNACFQSLCAWIAQLSLELAPRLGSSCFLASCAGTRIWAPLGPLRFLLVYSLSKFFVGLGRAASNRRAACFGALAISRGRSLQSRLLHPALFGSLGRPFAVEVIVFQGSCPLLLGP